MRTGAGEAGSESFGFPALMLPECHKRGVMAHAGIIDFMDGPESPAFKTHPDWAACNPRGDTLANEPNRGGKAGFVWMCPAQRPGHTDDWLFPLYTEFAKRCEFDAVHHDYIRYPCDVATDSYFFCDRCVADMPRFNVLPSS